MHPEAQLPKCLAVLCVSVFLCSVAVSQVSQGLTFRQLYRQIFRLNGSHARTPAGPPRNALGAGIADTTVGNTGPPSASIPGSTAQSGSYNSGFTQNVGPYNSALTHNSGSYSSGLTQTSEPYKSGSTRGPGESDGLLRGLVSSAYSRFLGDVGINSTSLNRSGFLRAAVESSLRHFGLPASTGREDLRNRPSLGTPGQNLRADNRSKSALAILQGDDDYTRLLQLFLRDMCQRLRNDSRTDFSSFCVGILGP